MNFNLNLTLDELNIVLALLAKGPFESVSQVIQKIREQADPQFAAQQQATAAQQEAEKPIQ